MARVQQDQFIDDDEDETCPLCVEEFDLNDKGFRPCPCGYQICQFCYHNVKSNMNGLCPACRRQYSDKDIEWKAVTPEETAAHKARQAQKQKKSQAALQKERAKAEADHLSRKHLAGLRVVQKNLVYVTGLNPTTQEDQLLATLRGDQYFGQYGKIIKIVVSKAKDPSHPHSVGVYVTYESKEDAASCIAAVNGSRNGERTLRAQFGTTKYCSAYLRGEQCSNRSCMFLHEPAEAGESYSRADLSALNAGSSQHGERAQPPPQSQQPVAASQPMLRQQSTEHPSSPTSDARPALPSTASWASKPQFAPSRAGSRSTSATVGSPAVTNATPAPSLSPPPPEQQPQQLRAAPRQSQSAAPLSSQPRLRKPRQTSPLLDLLKNFTVDDFKFVFSMSSLPPADLELVKNYPPLFDPNGGAKRRLRREREEEQRKRMEDENRALQPQSTLSEDDNPEMSGSLQLGGEPEERQSLAQATAIRPPAHDGGVLDQRFQFGSPTDVTHPTLSDQLLLQQAMQGSQPSPFQQNQQQSNMTAAPPGHQRNVSRFSFANDTSSASTLVKPIANAGLMNQQSSMMPQPQHQPQNASASQFYTSNVQGPPPGLKTTGTPPVSGGMTFAQGHGFATGGLQYNAGVASRGANEEMMRSLLRGGRDTSMALGGSVADAKQQHDADFPPLGTSIPTTQPSTIVRPDPSIPRRGTTSIPSAVGLQHTPGAESASSTRKSTPAIPPGLGASKGGVPGSGLPDLEGLASVSTSASRPGSRVGLTRQASGMVLPVLPLRPGTPIRAPLAVGKEDEDRIGALETPTRAPKTSTREREDFLVEDSRQGVAGISQGKEVSENDKAVSLRTKPSSFPDARTTAELTEDFIAPGSSAKPSNATDDRHRDTASEQAPLLAQRHRRQSSAPVAMQPASKGQATVQASETKAAPVAPSTPVMKGVNAQQRKHPGKLDINAAVNKQDQVLVRSGTAMTLTPVSASTLGKSRPVSQTPLGALTPAGSISSPAVKSAPRTLRLTQTPKTETPPAPPQQPLSTPNLSALPTRLPSRQPSVASINPPGTPSSEHVSTPDNISMASTSHSRTSSPAPGASRVAAALIRPKTKSQLKKERADRAKATEDDKTREEELVDRAMLEETAQEAIVGRKKKAKKGREPKVRAKTAANTTDTTPTASRPTSPGLNSVVDEAAALSAPVRESKPTTPTKPTLAATSLAPQPAISSPYEPSPPPTPTLTAQALLKELQATAPELQRCIDSLFRTSASSYYRPINPLTPQDYNEASVRTGAFGMQLDQKDVEALLTGRVDAVRYGGTDGHVWTRGMVTQTGAHLRALTQELEQRFLELEKALKQMPEQLRFRPAKPQNELKFPTKDLEALRRQFENLGQRGVSVMEQMVQDGSTMKKGAFLVDEASKYVNEFVMPPATPPPQQQQQQPVGGTTTQQQHPGMNTFGDGQRAPSLEAVERSLAEAKRIAEEKDGQLKKIVKKNRRLLGLD